MSWKEKLENNIVWFALGLLAVGWGAGVATCRFFPQLAGADPSTPAPPATQESEPSQQGLILPPTWIPANSGVPILAGKGMVSITDYLVRTNRNTTEVSLEVSLPGLKWDGQTHPWIIVGGGNRRFFTWQTKRYVVNVLTVEPDKAEVSITQLTGLE